jgi:hypothetical protein
MGEARTNLHRRSDDPGPPPDLRWQEPLRGAWIAAAPPLHGGLGFLLEVVPAVEVEEESGEAAVPRREEEDRCSGRPNLEEEEERATATAVVRDKGQRGE